MIWFRHSCYFCLRFFLAVYDIEKKSTKYFYEIITEKRAPKNTRGHRAVEHILELIL